MDIVLFSIRLAILASLYLFLLAVLLIVRNEFKSLGRFQMEPHSPSSGVKLVVMEAGDTGMSAGDVLQLEAETHIGRALDNTIVLLDSSVSCRHASLIQREGGWWLKDSGSTNGTLLNGNPVATEIAARPGDAIELGNVTLRLDES